MSSIKMELDGPEIGTLDAWKEWLEQAPCSAPGAIPIGYAKALIYAMREIKNLRREIERLNQRIAILSSDYGVNP